MRAARAAKIEAASTRVENTADHGRVADALRALSDDVQASLDAAEKTPPYLIQTLLENDLVDEFRLMIFPVVFVSSAFAGTWVVT